MAPRATTEIGAPQPWVIVAGGPSVNVNDVRTIGMAHAGGRCRVIAVNDAAYPCWFADHLHACDAKWWREHDGVPGFLGSKTSLEPTPYADVELLCNTGTEGFDPAPRSIRSGSNSGYQAIHLAAKLGARRIIVLGVDYTHDGARMHWFGTHKPGMDRHSDVQEWRRLLRGLTDELKKRGVVVENAGLSSTATWLPVVDLSIILS